MANLKTKLRWALSGSNRKNAFFVVMTLACLAATGVPADGHPIDTSKITASCGVSNSPKGPFNTTNPVALLTDAELIVQLSYHNDDVNNNSTYAANFTAAVSTSATFGAARTIDTRQFFGGQGLSTGGLFDIRIRAGSTPVQETIVIQVTSDVTGATVLASCNFSLNLILRDNDIDKDGIPDDVELHGLLDPNTGQLLLGADGKPVADFPSLGANPCRKDVAVQIDFQTGSNHTHQPDQSALDQAKTEFANAPVSGSPGCPYPGFDSEPGINLITDIKNSIPETTTTDAQGNTVIKAWDCNATIPFEPGRVGLFRHSLWVHVVPGGFSGLTPCSGTFTIALGTFGGSGQNGDALLQAGTFMHEMGHAFGLGHGGSDSINLKPNYLSVMNYSFQFGVPDNNGDRHARYSPSQLPELDEGALSEKSGVSGPTDRQTIWWGPHPGFFYPNAANSGPAAGPLDWNHDGNTSTGTVSGDANSDGVCIAPGADGVLETDPQGDDVLVSGLNMIFNGPNLACETRPCNRGNADVCDDQLNPVMLACVIPGANGTLDTVPGGDDVISNGQITAGPNAVCETTASGDDFQVTMPGRSEPRLIGHNDWDTILQSMAASGAGAPLPQEHNWTAEEAAAVAAATSGSAPANPDVSPPSTTASAAPSPNAQGWDKNDVTVTISATDPDGTGDVAAVGYKVGGPQPIAPTWVPGTSTTVKITAEGQTPVTYYSKDKAGNGDIATTLRLSIDKTAPVLIMPTLAASYPLNTSLTLTFNAQDSLSGLATEQATFDGNPVTSGANFTLNHLGTNSFTLTATDVAGNTASQTAPFEVQYKFSGFFSPLLIDGSGVYKLGSTVPVKFQLTDANGAVVSTATAHLTVQMFSGGTPIGSAIDATPPGSADVGDLFRFDGTQYIYNLSAKPLSTGTWQLQAHLDDGTVHTVMIGLK